MLAVFDHDPAGQAELRAGAGGAQPVRRIPALSRPAWISGSRVERRPGLVLPHQHSEELVAVIETIYAEPATQWAAYELCEELVDVEESFQLWRFRHMKTVERIIGYKPERAARPGSGSSARALDLTFFPELLDASHPNRLNPSGRLGVPAKCVEYGLVGRRAEPPVSHAHRAERHRLPEA